jgi:hypothetical protein
MAIDKFRRIGILINNAGVNVRKVPEEYTIDEWRTVRIPISQALFCARKPSKAHCRICADMLGAPLRLPEVVWLFQRCVSGNKEIVYARTNRVKGVIMHNAAVEVVRTIKRINRVVPPEVDILIFNLRRPGR